MPRVFVGNFDFENELAGGSPAGQLSTAARSVTAVLASAWLGMAEKSDFVLSPETISADAFPDWSDLGFDVPRFVTDATEIANGDARETGGLGNPHDELVPWGWSPAMLALAENKGWRHSAPPLETVRQVNRREFRWLLEQEWGIALPGSGLVRTRDELCALLRENPADGGRWVLKGPLGMSGRERIVGRGEQLAVASENWLAQRLARGETLVFEPRLSSIAEAGVQITIPETGVPELVGVTPLLTDRSGTYRGSRFGDDAFDVEPWREAIGVAIKVAIRIQELGYFGPLGIDSMSYRAPSGEIRIRPLQDLNARYTMGRLALGFRKALPPGWCASWLHLKDHGVAKRLAVECRRISSEVRTVWTSPARIGNRKAESASLLVLAPDVEQRDRVEQSIVRAQGWIGE